MRTSDKQIRDFGEVYLDNMKKHKTSTAEVNAVSAFLLELLTNGIFGARSVDTIASMVSDYEKRTGKKASASAQDLAIKAAEQVASHKAAKAEEVARLAAERLAVLKSGGKASKAKASKAEKPVASKAKAEKPVAKKASKASKPEKTEA